MLRFIDLFSGCGGLSLGLSLAGAQGVFAIERDTMAFSTFEANLLGVPTGPARAFEWPAWLEQRAWGIDDLLKEHASQLTGLRGTIDLIAGGPPCQGFSFAGRRDPDDPRNQMFTRYLEVVKLVQPTAILLENVPGMAVAHRTPGASGAIEAAKAGSFFDVLATELDSLGYDVQGKIIDASLFGVPQRRTRLIVVGLRRVAAAGSSARAVFDCLESRRSTFLKSLPLKETPVTAEEAIGDLSVYGRDDLPWSLQSSVTEGARGEFLEVVYDGRRSKSGYQKLMRRGAPLGDLDSMRLARHSEVVAARFLEIIRTCPKGVKMNNADRTRFGLKKHRIYPMRADEPAPTITTLPDDVLHFRDPRILTVRESGRLQSFPDYFVFRGKYTTGGHKRTRECPRYTQVGNAVPPLLAQAFGEALVLVLKPSRPKRQESTSAETPESAIAA